MPRAKNVTKRTRDTSVAASVRESPGRAGIRPRTITKRTSWVVTTGGTIHVQSRSTSTGPGQRGHEEVKPVTSFMTPPNPLHILLGKTEPRLDDVLAVASHLDTVTEADSETLTKLLTVLDQIFILRKAPKKTMWLDEYIVLEPSDGRYPLQLFRTNSGVFLSPDSTCDEFNLLQNDTWGSFDELLEVCGITRSQIRFVRQLQQRAAELRKAHCVLEEAQRKLAAVKSVIFRVKL